MVRRRKLGAQSYVRQPLAPLQVRTWPEASAHAISSSIVEIIQTCVKGPRLNVNARNPASQVTHVVSAQGAIRAPKPVRCLSLDGEQQPGVPETSSRQNDLPHSDFSFCAVRTSKVNETH